MAVHEFYKRFQFNVLYPGETSAIGIARFQPKPGFPTSAIVKILNSSHASSCKEIQITSNLQNKSRYIVQLYCYYQVEHSYVMFLEHCKGGSLHEELKIQGRNWGEDKLVEWFRQMTDAVGAMHKGRFAHRDIKPANIFLTENGEIRLGDFGASCAVREGKKTHYPVGTLNYLPEALKTGTEVQTEGAYLHDIWSLGRTFYEMCMGRYSEELESNANMQSILQTVNANLIARGISGELVGLITRMLSAEIRPMSISEVSDALIRLQTLRNPINPSELPIGATLPQSFLSIRRSVLRCQYSDDHPTDSLQRMSCGHTICKPCLTLRCKDRLSCPICTLT